MITITEKASTKIKEISEGDEIGHNRIRLKVVGGGCAGMSYDLYFDDNTNELDEVFNQHDVSVIVDPLSFQYVDGITIDYKVVGPSEGFHFENPNVSSVCGCQKSFSI